MVLLLTLFDRDLATYGRSPTFFVKMAVVPGSTTNNGHFHRLMVDMLHVILRGADEEEGAGGTEEGIGFRGELVALQAEDALF